MLFSSLLSSLVLIFVSPRATDFGMEYEMERKKGHVIMTENATMGTVS